ncbi:hypothetical protein HMPREF0185_00418 [Brevundimonas diminuta 470-4]|nr:hypothetical protein HMPREF0185_00418 [Brevundimonas diminuta 470-4]
MKLRRPGGRLRRRSQQRRPRSPLATDDGACYRIRRPVFHERRPGFSTGRGDDPTVAQKETPSS